MTVKARTDIPHGPRRKLALVIGIDKDWDDSFLLLIEIFKKRLGYSEKSWLDLQYHQNGTGLIKRPHELEENMQFPPEDINYDILNRIQGSMVGMALGDALGAHVEFRPRAFLLQNPVVDLKAGGTWGLKEGQKGALAAVNLGDDTDTTAAIYGQLAGAYYGYEKLPKKWVEKVYAKRFLQGLSMWIAYEGQMWYENKALLFNPSLATVAPKQKVVAISSNEQELNPEKLPSIQLTSLEETRRVGLSNRSEKDTSSVMSNFCAIL
ncbi:unnamed protein product [Rotaria sordida]|uniref:ADP-ribosylhydrolase ARH3 n=1 Tax=Rotaria sordida TaxID=392033 RepID=A0A819K695_9BILA|nr:unnamed protein product [Rotaria sordida]